MESATQYISQRPRNSQLKSPYNPYPPKFEFSAMPLCLTKSVSSSLPPGSAQQLWFHSLPPQRSSPRSLLCGPRKESGASRSLALWESRVRLWSLKGGPGRGRSRPWYQHPFQGKRVRARSNKTGKSASQHWTLSESGSRRLGRFAGVFYQECNPHWMRTQWRFGSLKFKGGNIYPF